MIIDRFNVRPSARGGAQYIAYQLEIDLVMRGRIARRVHELNGEIDALGRRVGEPRGENILLAQDRDLAVDHQARALIGIGDDALADDDALARLKLNLQG